MQGNSPPPQGRWAESLVTKQVRMANGTWREEEGRRNERKKGKQQLPHRTQLWPPRTEEAGSHSSGQGPRAFDCAGCKGWGLVYAPPRLSVCVCARVAGTEEDTVFWTWAGASCQVRIVSSCLVQMLPGRDILRPLLDFLGTGMWSKPLSKTLRVRLPRALTQTLGSALGPGNQQTSPARRRGAFTLASPAR